MQSFWDGLKKGGDGGMNVFEEQFERFVIYPGVVFAFIAGIYYIVYLAPDLHSKLAIGFILLLGAIAWVWVLLEKGIVFRKD